MTEDLLIENLTRMVEDAENAHAPRVSLGIHLLREIVNRCSDTTVLINESDASLAKMTRAELIQVIRRLERSVENLKKERTHETPNHD